MPCAGLIDINAIAAASKIAIVAIFSHVRVPGTGLLRILHKKQLLSGFP